MKLSKKYSQNVVNKALSMQLKLIRDNEKYVVYHAPATHSEFKHYKVIYNKKFKEISCECQEFKHKGKCSHSLRALQLINGSNWLFNNLQLQ